MHELGHHVNRDIRLFIAYETVSITLGLFLASLALKWGVTRFGLKGVNMTADRNGTTLTSCSMFPYFLDTNSHIIVHDGLR